MFLQNKYFVIKSLLSLQKFFSLNLRTLFLYVLLHNKDRSRFLKEGYTNLLYFLLQLVQYVKDEYINKVIRQLF